MRNFKDTFETRKRSLMSAFSICMTVPWSVFWNCILANQWTGFSMIGTLSWRVKGHYSMKMFPYLEYSNTSTKISPTNLRDKVFKNGPSEICGRQPLKNLKWYGLLKQTIPHFKFFKGYLPQILLGPFLK